MKKKKSDEKLKYYLSLDYPMLISHDKEEGIYVIQFPDLPGCMAHGSTPTSALKLAKEIKREWIEDSLESGQTISVPKKEEEYSGRFVLRMPSFLHKTLTEQAQIEGHSLNQHINILVSNRSSALSFENSLVRLSRIEDRLQKQTSILAGVTAQMIKLSTGSSEFNVKTLGQGQGVISRAGVRIKTYTLNSLQG